MDMHPAEFREPGVHGKAIHGRVIEIQIPLLFERRISWLTEWEGRIWGRKEWFVCNSNLIYSNLVMAEMDSRLLYRLCLLFLLTLRAKFTVTGSAFGQLNHSWGDEALRPEFRPTWQQKGAQSWLPKTVMATQTILENSLPPRPFTMWYKPTHKQTQMYQSHKQTDNKGCLKS